MSSLILSAGIEKESSKMRKTADKELKKHLDEELIPLLAKAGFEPKTLGVYSDGRPTGGFFEKEIAKTDNGNVTFGLNIEFPEHLCGEYSVLQKITVKPYVNCERYIADRKGRELKWEVLPEGAMMIYQKIVNKSQRIIHGLLLFSISKYTFLMVDFFIGMCSPDSLEACLFSWQVCP